MNFSKFYAVSADTDTIIFKGSKTYTISDSLTLGGMMVQSYSLQAMSLYSGQLQLLIILEMPNQ
jgi:hypothetical protein